MPNSLSLICISCAEFIVSDIHMQQNIHLSSYNTEGSLFVCANAMNVLVLNMLNLLLGVKIPWDTRSLYTHSMDNTSLAK